MVENRPATAAVMVVGNTSSARARAVERALQGLDGVRLMAPGSWSEAAAGAGTADLVVALSGPGPGNVGAFLDALAAVPETAHVPAVVVAEEDDGSPLAMLGHPAVVDLILPGAGDGEVAARLRAAVERARVAWSLRSRGRHLEELLSRQTEFLSVVSHEIRTPLSSIQSAANILLRYGRQRPEAVERFAGVIHQESKRLTRLIDNLLDLAKIEAGQVEWTFEPVSVPELLEGVRDSFAALARERGVRLTVVQDERELDADLDRDKMVQVLANLVANALKVSPPGTAVRLHLVRGDAGRLQVRVEDEGPGIPAGLEEEVFGRFRQLEGGEETGGTGLGLTISRHIVEHHQGRIWAEQGRTIGACFVVDLPVRRHVDSDHGPVR